MLRVQVANTSWLVETEPAHDLSIPLAFDGAQPTFFGAPWATSTPLAAGSFVGDVRRGGSCNCASYSLTPHCGGTHTECVGHITLERMSVRDVARAPLYPAVLLSVSAIDAPSSDERSDPAPQPGDRLITRSELLRASAGIDVRGSQALVVRTLPNATDKQWQNYDTQPPPPYFSLQAMQWIVEIGIEHLIVDLPSIDRSSDEGRLSAHRVFWGMPPGEKSAAAAARASATITELAYIDDAVPDGYYMLSLQIAPFVADAAPSRPLLYRRIAA
jgi:arylformamidase